MKQNIHSFRIFLLGVLALWTLPFASAQSALEASQTEGRPPLDVQFSINPDSLPDGVLSYEWVFGNGEKSKEKAPAIRFTHPGKFDAELRLALSNGKEISI